MSGESPTPREVAEKYMHTGDDAGKLRNDTPESSQEAGLIAAYEDVYRAVAKKAAQNGQTLDTWDLGGIEEYNRLSSEEKGYVDRRFRSRVHPGVNEEIDEFANRHASRNLSYDVSDELKPDPLREHGDPEVIKAISDVKQSK
jgi:hypothetical protein